MINCFNHEKLDLTTGSSFLPKGVLKDDCILRKILRSRVEMRSFIKVAWFEIVSPKKERGLCVPNIFYCNKANMARHLWDVASNKDSVGSMVPHLYLEGEECMGL